MNKFGEKKKVFGFVGNRKSYEKQNEGKLQTVPSIIQINSNWMVIGKKKKVIISHFFFLCLWEKRKMLLFV